MRRSSTRPMKSQVISSAPVMLIARMASSSTRPVKIACVDACVASSVLAWAALTRPFTSATSSTERSRLRSSSSAWRSAIRSSAANRSNTVSSPEPRAKRRTKTGAASAWKEEPTSADRFLSMRLTVDSKRSRSGSISDASGRVKALARSSVAMFTSACNSARRR